MVKIICSLILIELISLKFMMLLKLKTEEKKMLTMKVDGMMCNNCVNHVKKALEGFEGVSAEVDLEAKEAKVKNDGNATVEQLKNAVEEAGYTVLSVE